MDRSLIMNRIRSLYNIDKFKIDDELRAAGQVPLTDDDWLAFRKDPSRFFINTDKPTADAIWACVEARQPKDGDSVEAEAARRLATLNPIMAAAIKPHFHD